MQATPSSKPAIPDDAQCVWQKLADIPVNESDEIELPFEHFEVGTHREDIWHWLESTYDVSVHELMTASKDDLRG